MAAVESQMVQRDEFVAEIRERLLQAQALMKNQYDERHRDVEFSVGDWVWLCIHHHAATTVAGQTTSKLGPRFFGPYQVINHIGSVVYRLQLPAKANFMSLF